MVTLHPTTAPGPPPVAGWRRRLHEIIFEADTRAGRAFDVALLAVILLSVLAVLLGDIAPSTPLGRLLAACVMILGYGILAVPTGIVSVELAQVTRSVSTQACPACGRQGHDIDARHCKHCGAVL